ncbi:MAG: hypothetical protein WCX81_03365 [Monoglobales bacterium]
MAYSYDFKDNIVYGADDINAIRTSILTKGVIEEAADSLKVVSYNGGVKVLEGQAIFADGCRISVDGSGVEREIASGVKSNVYLNNNRLAGVCEVIASTQAPEGDYVLLAEVDEGGIITDKREYAQLKTADSERYVESFSAEFDINNTPGSPGASKAVTLPKTNCSMVEFCLSYAGTQSYFVTVFPKENGHIIWRYPNGAFYSGDRMEINLFSRTRLFSFNVSGNVMTVTLESINQPSADLHTIKIDGYCLR